MPPRWHPLRIRRAGRKGPIPPLGGKEVHAKTPKLTTPSQKAVNVKRKENTPGVNPLQVHREVLCSSFAEFCLSGEARDEGQVIATQSRFSVISIYFGLGCAFDESRNTK